jgi:hypothetical protein
MQNVGIAGLALVLVLASNAIGLLLQSRLREPDRRQERGTERGDHARAEGPEAPETEVAPYAKASATARPIPESAPVVSAVFPLNLFEPR